MATQVTNTLTAIVTTQEDITGSVPINRGTGNPAFDCNVGAFTTYQQLAAGNTDLQLPKATVYQVYIKNLDSTNTVTVQWTISGGAQLSVCNLTPGDQIIMWCNPAIGSAGAGVSAIRLIAQGGTALVEYFIGA